MALFKKFDVAAATKTHGEVDASLVDLINPSVPLNSTGELMRMGVSGLVGYAIRGKMITGSWSLTNS